MKKIVTSTLLFFLGVVLVLSPFGIFALIARSQPHVYAKTYYAALVDKVNYLKSLQKQKKIVLVGGSNVAFGFNSELLEKEFSDYKVVNFGLYAMLGTKIMMDLSLEYIGKGDMVFIIPEINSQSTSLYFNSSATLKAIEDDDKLLWKLPEDNRKSVFGEYFNFVSERAGIKEIIEPSEVYQRKNFNKHGDIEYLGTDEQGQTISLRTSNKMKSKHYIDPMVEYKTSDVAKDFVSYVNNYNASVKAKGATLYYSFSPVNNLSVTSDEETINNYYWNLRNKLACPVVGHPNEYIFDAHYFYDSNFHLNDAGSVLRSYVLASDIYRDILVSTKEPSFAVPEKPEYPPVDVAEEDDSETCIYFDLEETSDGYAIIGLKDNALAFESIMLPAIYNHKYVTAIHSKAFAKSSVLASITVPDSYSYFEDGAFDACKTLKSVYLQELDPSELMVSYLGGLVEDVHPDFTFYVPSQSLSAYITDYNWQTYKAYLRGYQYDPDK